jgi:predicted butyrate kinase (DUF1464 family)
MIPDDPAPLVTLCISLLQGRYKRLDRFQEDMFEVFEYARSVSRSDSQVRDVSTQPHQAHAAQGICFLACGMWDSSEGG